MYVTFEPRLWVPFVPGRDADGGGNPDILDYVGLGQLKTEVGWHSLLHANYGAWMKLYLLNRKNVIVTNVRYFVDEPASDRYPLAPDTPASAPPGEDRRPAVAEVSPKEGSL